MNLKDLTYLVAVADTGTVRAAAQRCGIAQPTLSIQLAKLEAELDCTLFERGRRGVTPTEQGLVAIEKARQIIDLVADLKQGCRHRGEPLAGPFKLGLIMTVGPYLMPDVLPMLRKHYPTTEFLLREDITPNLVARLKRGELDAAVLSRPVFDAGLHLFDFYEEPLRLIAPKDHPLAGTDPVTHAQLRKHRMLLLEDGHCLRDQTVSACRLFTSGKPAPDEVQATTVESLRQMVAAGIGVSVLPELAVRGRFARVAGVVTCNLEPAPRRVLTLATRDSHPAMGAIRELASALNQALKPAP